MKKAKRIWLASLLAAVLGGFIWLMLRPSQPEPTYQGKPLSFWLEGFDQGNYKISRPWRTTPPTWEEADEALRKIGTNAIPTLLRILQERDSEFKIKIVGLLQRQHLIRIPFASLYREDTALHGFNILGPAASNAVPRLIEIFESDPFPFPKQAIPVILGHIGPTALPAIPSLLRWITHTNGFVRNNVIFALRRIQGNPTLVVPALIKCLKDPDVFVRAQAARGLGSYGKDAQSAVPAPLELWRKEPPRPSRSARVAIDGTLVGFSWAIPPFLYSRDAPDVGDIASQALKEIDPEAAAKAGVK